MFSEIDWSAIIVAALGVLGVAVTGFFALRMERLKNQAAASARSARDSQEIALAAARRARKRRKRKKPPPTAEGE